MPFEPPVSTSHSLLTLNETMRSDILRDIHHYLHKYNDDKNDSRSPLDWLIESLERTLDLYNLIGEGGIDSNPFNTADPMYRYKFKKEEAYKHDMKLMKFQLKALKKMKSEFTH